MRCPVYLLLLGGFFLLTECTDKGQNRSTPTEVKADSTLMMTITKDIRSAEVMIGEQNKKSTFTLVDSSLFRPQRKKILLLEKDSSNQLLLFKTKLQVNTDGTPLSYHPQDLSGKTKAINTIGNAVAIYKEGEEGNIFLKRGHYSEAMMVFERFRDSEYEIVPEGYRISWKNVLIAEKVGSKEKPCIFKSGKYRGYYASATALQNGLRSNKGDCNARNQVNPLEVPAFVLVGGKNNPLRNNGARLGDLLIAFNPKNKAISYAIINDIGPRNKLGEGSVLLNMQLNRRSDFPKNRKDTYGLVTKNEVIIAIIPGSRNYQRVRPYTGQNIKKRITSWLNENGFATEAELMEFLQKNKEML